MNGRIAHLITHFYPRSWRDRYGEEFEAVLTAESGSLRIIFNVICAALGEHIIPAYPLPEGQSLQSFGLIVKKPSAVIPIGMSFAALAVVLAQIAVAGIARESDEGAAAHAWQLLMAGQIPILLFFAIKWLPNSPRQALRVLAVQVAAMMASITPVFLLKW